MTTRWHDLQLEETRLKIGRYVIQLLQALESQTPPGASNIQLNEESIQDALAGLVSPIPSWLIDSLLEASLSNKIQTIPNSLDSLIKELDETLQYESRILSAEY